MHQSIALLFALIFSLTSSITLAQTLVRLDTNLGSMTLELADNAAPKTVENFLDYVKSGFYAGTIFHRVIDNFMIQGGGFTQEFKKKATRPGIQNEANNGLQNLRGTIAMARTSDPHSATAQFFINVKDNDFLNHTAPDGKGWGYTVFGKVVDGMAVVDKIRQLPTGRGGPGNQFRDVPKTPVVIEKIVILSTPKDTKDASPANKSAPKDTEDSSPANYDDPNT